jgi:pimeloyl-ACP methyl ester carboxylesterase
MKAGDVVLFVHGNPTWSFMYRHLIEGLRSGFRCLAPDNIGFGLSGKPQGPSYLPQFHAENLKEFIERVGLKDITLVVHDWGGPIGMSYAVDHPENIKRLVILNTTCWSLKGIKAAERFASVVGSPFGHFLFRYLNAFPRYIVPSLFADRSRLTPTALRHYTAPFSSPEVREAPWILIKALISQSDWMDSIWHRRDRLRTKPVQILAGQKDPTFGPEKLARWQQGFPRSTTKLYPNVGHFVAEEAGPELLAPIRSFLTGADSEAPLSSEASL